MLSVLFCFVFLLKTRQSQIQFPATSQASCAKLKKKVGGTPVQVDTGLDLLSLRTSGEAPGALAPPWWEALPHLQRGLSAALWGPGPQGPLLSWRHWPHVCSLQW